MNSTSKTIIQLNHELIMKRRQTHPHKHTHTCKRKFLVIPTNPIAWMMTTQNSSYTCERNATPERFVRLTKVPMENATVACRLMLVDGGRARSSLFWGRFFAPNSRHCPQSAHRHPLKPWPKMTLDSKTTTKSKTLKLAEFSWAGSEKLREPRNKVPN